MSVRLEDLRESPQLARELYEFLGQHFDDGDFATFARPHNVNRPEDRMLDDAQRQQFDAITGGIMDRLGYGGRAEYAVSY